MQAARVSHVTRVQKSDSFRYIEPPFQAGRVIPVSPWRADLEIKERHAGLQISNVERATRLRAQAPYLGYALVLAGIDPKSTRRLVTGIQPQTPKEFHVVDVRSLPILGSVLWRNSLCSGERYGCNK